LRVQERRSSAPAFAVPATLSGSHLVPVRCHRAPVCPLVLVRAIAAPEAILSDLPGDGDDWRHCPDCPGLVDLEDRAEAKTGARAECGCRLSDKSNRRELPLQLSPEAQARGWTGLMQAQRMGRPEEDAPILQDEFFAGQSVPRLLLTPLCGTALLFLLYLALLEKFGRQSKQEERHGRRTKGPELLSAFRWNRSGKRSGIRLKLRSKFGLLPSGFRIPKKLESSHILLMGDTGSGKSNAIRQILWQVQKRGETAIVYDPAGEFVQEFYRPERRDLILNPLDARCPFWNLQTELDGRGIEDAIAAAMLPEKQYENGFFTDAPRRVLGRLLSSGASVETLLEWMADPAQIERRLAGTPQAAYLDRNAGPQRAGVLSSLNMIADSLALLPRSGEAKEWFDTGKWKYERTQWVFLTSRPAMRERIRPLHSAWLDLLILQMMEPCVNPAKPVWFVLDELASLNKLPQLHTAVTENRKYGNPVVLGFQGRSQLEKRYGQDAEAMLSQPATKIFFKTSEPRAAKWISETLEPVMNFVFASPLESVNDVDSLALQETARPQTVPQTRFGGRIYSETGHFSRKFSSRTRSKFITGSRGNRGRADQGVAQCRRFQGGCPVRDEPAAEVVRHGDCHQTSRHGLRNRRPGTLERVYQAGEQSDAGDVRLCAEAKSPAGVHGAEDDHPGAKAVAARSSGGGSEGRGPNSQSTLRLSKASSEAKDRDDSSSHESGTGASSLRRVCSR